MDVQFFVSAVLLQKRTGGNLAELLDKLAHIIRERFKLRARIRAVSAQGLMSGRILAAIPVGVGGADVRGQSRATRGSSSTTRWAMNWWRRRWGCSSSGT